MRWVNDPINFDYFLYSQRMCFLYVTRSSKTIMKDCSLHTIYMSSFRILTKLITRWCRCLSTLSYRKSSNKVSPKLTVLDEEIIRQGDEGHFMWVLLRGSARVVINGNSVAVLKDNSAFGEAALKHKVKRNASIIAQEQWEVLILHKDEYDRVIYDSDLIKKRSNQAFINDLSYLSTWDLFKKHYFNEIIDSKILNHNEKVYCQNDMAFSFNIIVQGYVKLCSTIDIETVSLQLQLCRSRGFQRVAIAGRLNKITKRVRYTLAILK